MPVVDDLWSAAATPSPAPPRYVPVPVPIGWTERYSGAFRDRQSRFDLRRVRRYGGYSGYPGGYTGYVYEAPLLLLWADDYGEAGDVWEL